MKDMKHIIFFFITIITFKPVFGQYITNNDSINANYKIYEGRIKSNVFEGGYGTYILAVSKYYNFIEISSVFWQSISVKYRLEKLSNFQVFSITKTMFQEKDSIPICYVAIDSNMANKIKKGKKGFCELNNEKIYTELHETESMILSLFSKIIIQHNLQTEYFNYEHKSFVAWLKVKK